jgi:hypothetical protein
VINKGDVGVYEFGREMQSYTVLKSSLLEKLLILSTFILIFKKMGKSIL